MANHHDIRDALACDFCLPVELNESHIRDFFGVQHVELEPDGSIYVERPIAGHYLSRSDIECCMRFMSARLNCTLAYFAPAHRTTVRPLRQN